MILSCQLFFHNYCTYLSYATFHTNSSRDIGVQWNRVPHFNIAGPVSMVIHGLQIPPIVQMDYLSLSPLSRHLLRCPFPVSVAFNPPTRFLFVCALCICSGSQHGSVSPIDVGLYCIKEIIPLCHPILCLLIKE